MIYNDENLDFDNISFETDNEVDLKLEDAGDIVLELTELNDHQDIPMCVTIAPKSMDKIAQDIEEVILNLLENGDRDTLLLLTGEKPDLASNIDQNLQEDFAVNYSQAVIYNPAIKWYSRLVSILPEDQFFVKNGQLQVHIPKNTFNKLIKPFLIDFDNKFYEISPIVALVLNCAERLAQQTVDITNKTHKQVKKENYEEGLDVSDAELDFFFDTDAIEHAGNVRVDDNDSLNQSGVTEVTSSLHLEDLSNKAIAELFADKGYSEKQASDKLMKHIPEKGRRNEILVLLNLAKKLNNSPLQHLRPIAKRTNPDKDNFKWDSDE